MDYKLINSYTNANQAVGITVVIDVLRAFTTACYIAKGNSKAIIVVEKLSVAYQYKQNNPEYILVGERKGLKQKGFTYGNSPAELKEVDFTNKSVILTTSSGTRGINRAVNAQEILTGSFVNASATAAYIKKKKPKTVSFICTDDTYFDNEDFLCAAYIKSLIDGEPLDFDLMRDYLYRHPCAEGFIKKPMTKYAKEDFALALTIDKFDFALRVEKDNNEQTLLRKVTL